ncbi:MAG TPA: hypothetical protein VEZ14_04290 [Dehalococcoidia bacterium]|nr:hypothetical protein [Dehalococcoidia bacterium]
MPLFTRKPAVTVEDFCREFYDRSIFHPVISGADLTNSMWDVMYDEVLKVDPSIEQVDRAAFYAEMTALRLELFSLAFLHNLRSDDFSVRQVMFTDKYLVEEGRADLEAALPEYTNAVSESAMDTATGEKARRGRAAFLNAYHVGVYKKLAERAEKAGIRDKAYFQGVATTLNRYDTNGAWRQTLTHRRLAFTLAKRLGIEPNEQGWLRPQTFIDGMYEGASGAISRVRLV